MAALAWASTAPVVVRRAPDAVLRLAWSARPERIERCRPQTAEALARLPPHMRQPLICEGAAARYRLTVRHGGRVLVDQEVTGGGLRQDRRLYVHRELPVRTGTARVEVRLDRIDESSPPADTGDTTRAAAVASGPRSPQAATVPAHLVFEEDLVFRPHEVVLVTFDPERAALVAVQPRARPGV
jgi:hypothetical protein